MGFDFKTNLDLNKFWDKTPTVLKYVLLICVIVAGSYFLFSRKIDTSQLKELDKIQQGIEVTYQLVDKFESFQRFQNEYNDEIIKDVRNIYILITELNSNINSKFNYLIENSGEENKDLLDKLDILNESFERLSNAYKPEKIEPKELKPDISVKKIDTKKNENEWK